MDLGAAGKRMTSAEFSLRKRSSTAFSMPELPLFFARHVTVTLGCFAQFGKTSANFSILPHLRRVLANVRDDKFRVASIARLGALRFQAPQPP
jgi:hypothetical protein